MPSRFGGTLFTMQGNREERLAKAKGLGILALMAGVALAVHVWPRPVPDPAPAAAADGVLRAQATAAPVRVDRVEPARRRLRAAARAERPVAPASIPKPAAPARPGDSVGEAALASLPGSAVALPSRPPAVHAKHPGAVTRAAQATGKGLAGAFKKTGAAFRRAF